MFAESFFKCFPGSKEKTKEKKKLLCFSLKHFYVLNTTEYATQNQNVGLNTEDGSHLTKHSITYWEI